MDSSENDIDVTEELNHDDGELDITDYMACLEDDDIKDEEYLYELPELSRVITNFGKSLKDEDWIRKHLKTDLELNHYDSNDSMIKEPLKYMSAKIIESNEALNQFLDSFVFDLKNSCQEICDHGQADDDSDLSNTIKDLADADSLTTGLKSKTAVETYYAGRIRYGYRKSGKLNYKFIYLEAPFTLGRGEIIALDLSFLKSTNNSDENADYSLFPGKIVVLKGRNLAGNCITVSRFIKFDRILKPNFMAKCPPILMPPNESLNIVCACGPFIKMAEDSNQMDFTNVTTMKRIADYLKHYNPDVLFIFGPFFDDSMYEILLQWSLKSDGDVPVQWNLDKLFHHQIRCLCKEIEGTSCTTRIVIIPSSNEFGLPNMYPMYPVEVRSNRKILSFSNPSLINLNGILIGLSSTDILLHLSRHEIYKINMDQTKTKKAERLQRLCEHVLNHRHFYPMLPPDPSLNMEYHRYHQMTMPITPHLLILPSMLRPFVFNANGTIVVNPGKASKNAITRIMVEPLSDPNDYSGSLSENINVEIIKLKY